MLAEITAEELSTALDRVAADALWEASIDRPPVDAFALARRLGIAVAEDRTLVGRARFVRLATPAGTPYVASPREGGITGAILVRPGDRPERLHWAVAHEVGESIAHRVFESLGVRPGEASADARERVANALAGRLLAPRRWLLALAREEDCDLAALKDHFRTASHELLARRLVECAPHPVVATVVDQGAVSWRRGAQQTPPMTELERRCAAECQALGEPLIADRVHSELGPSAEHIVRVRAWPVHEPGWRREVLLTDLVEGFDEAA